MPRDHTLVIEYHSHRLEYLRDRRRERERKLKNANAHARREGYYAPVDCKGRLLLLEGLWIMTYPERVVVERAAARAGGHGREQSGGISNGDRTRQADTRKGGEMTDRMDVRTNEEELKRLLSNLEGATRQGQVDVAHSAILAAFAELRAEIDLAAIAAILAKNAAILAKNKIMQERDLLREAVEAVEWISNPDPDFGERYKLCPWCTGIVKYGHEPYCLRQRALGITKGAKS